MEQHLWSDFNEIGSGSTLFGQTCLSENLGSLRYVLILSTINRSTKIILVCIFLGVRQVVTEQTITRLTNMYYTCTICTISGYVRMTIIHKDQDQGDLSRIYSNKRPHSNKCPLPIFILKMWLNDIQKASKHWTFCTFAHILSWGGNFLDF